MEKQMSESFMIASILAIVGGFFDAYTYVCRDQVFANAQTGNIVRVSMTFANHDYLQTIRYLIPIIAFGLGVILTMFIRDYYKNKTYIHWRQVILIIEMLVVFIVGWIPIGKWNLFVNIMISFICAMQAECFRKVLGKPYSSTMCTGNLRSCSEYFYHSLKHDNHLQLMKCIHYLFIILFFMSGAILGVKITDLWNEKAVWICLLPMFIALSLMFKKPKTIVSLQKTS